MSKKAASLIDNETIAFLDGARNQDTLIVNSIALERRNIDFKFGHTERLNNWRTDELHIEKANIAEATFLSKLQDEEQAQLLDRQTLESTEEMAVENDQKTFNLIVNEMKSLKLQCLQNKEAADKLKRAKKTLKSRRAAVQSRLTRLESLQEQQRRNLSEAHTRALKEMKLGRNLRLREVEDPEMRIVLNGHEFNAKTLAAESAKDKAILENEARILNSRIFSKMVINQKEIEQLREVHLLSLKQTTKVCDLEIDALDEIESLEAQHRAQENKMEADLKAITDKEEARVLSEMAASRVYASQRQTHHFSTTVRMKQQKEAKALELRQHIEAEEREKLFWKQEEEALRCHLSSTGQDQHLTDHKAFEKIAEQLLDRGRLNQKPRLLLRGESDDDEFKDLEDDIAADLQTSINESERMFAREMFKIESMKKNNSMQLMKFRHKNKKTLEAIRKSSQQALKELMESHDEEMNVLQEQQEVEMNSMKETQELTEKVDEGNKVLNDKLSAMLPKFVIDAMKHDEKVPPREFDNLVFLTADIVSFTSLSSKSSAGQIISLLNRLYSQMDDVLDSFPDVFKLETIGDAYCIVSGLNSQDRPVKYSVTDIVECALSFIEIVNHLDMSDQIQKDLKIRIGIHVGPAVGGVATSSIPKFSLFGDTVTLTSLLEQSSRPNEIHVSAPIAEFIKDDYEFDVSESIMVESSDGGAKRKVGTFWLVGKSTGRKGESVGGVASKKAVKAPKAATSRSLRFD
ncbi:Guanylate cyclase 2G, partial [Irineochytrium annulatum]